MPANNAKGILENVSRGMRIAAASDITKLVRLTQNWAKNTC